jgi:hypothetical protein
MTSNTCDQRVAEDGFPLLYRPAFAELWTVRAEKSHVEKHTPRRC